MLVTIRQNPQPLRKLTYKLFTSEQGLNLKMEALDLAPVKFKKTCRRATTKSISVLFFLPESYMVRLPLENVSGMGHVCFMSSALNALRRKLQACTFTAGIRLRREVSKSDRSSLEFWRRMCQRPYWIRPGTFI